MNFLIGVDPINGPMSTKSADSFDGPSVLDSDKDPLHTMLARRVRLFTNKIIESPVSYRYLFMMQFSLELLEFLKSIKLLDFGNLSFRPPSI